jgi:nucleoside-diphosphate-sugar epimerase
MAKVLLIGCGDLGTAVAVNLHNAGHEVIGVRKSKQLLPLSMRTIHADVTDFDALKPLSQIQPEVLIYCVAATAQTDENYYQHYVLGLKNVLATQQQNTQLKHVFFVSSTRVYGQNTGELIDEHVPATPKDFGGERLLEAEQLLSQLSCASTALRLSGIYGVGRLYLINMAQDPSRWPAENQWSNRIHRDDAAGFIAFLTQQVIAGHPLHTSYIVTDNKPTPQYEVLMWLAEKLGRKAQYVSAPLATAGKRLSNQRMLETGFQLTYPSYQEGYSTLIQSMA